MVILTHDAFTVMGDLQDLLAVLAKLKRQTNPPVVPGLLVHPHA